MTPASVLRNVRLLGTTAFRHLGDDPLHLLLQISRRLPAGLVYRVAGLASIVGRDPVTQALTAHLRGDAKKTRAVLQTALASDGDRPRAARPAPGDRPRAARPALRSPNGHFARLAELALATHDTDLADALLHQAGPAPATRARRCWYGGDMSGAVRVLRAAGKHRAADRYESELRAFSGWTPTLDSVPGYVPAAQTVLHVLTNSLPHTGSGYAQRSHSILKAQHDAGWTVHAATRVGYPVQVGKLFAADLDQLDGVSYHRLLPSRPAEGFDARLQQQAEELLALARRVRPAVMHTTTHFVNGLVAREVARALGIPWAYEVRGQLADTWASSRPDAAKRSERYKLFTESEGQVMQSASLVVTLGEAMKQDIMGKGVNPNNILLCPNAVGDEYLNEPLDACAARSRLGLPADGVFVGTVSSIVDYEGLDDLLHALALLAPQHPGLRCLVVGDGVALPSLKALALELGVSALVTFTGRVGREQAHLHYQALDIFAVPRRDLEVTRSVTPLKPVEAMACARPVVASDLPALRELITGDTGVLTTAGDVDALAAGIASLIDDDGARLTADAASRGAAGRRRVLAERTWERTSSALLDAYASLGCSA